MLRVVVLLGVMVSTAANAQPAQPPAFDAQARAEVAAVSPEAAAAYDRGNAAREAKHLEEAIEAYQRAIELAPAVSHPHRRLCGMYMIANRNDDAVTECERALTIEPALAYNKSSLAAALLSRQKPADVPRALSLATDGANALPDDAFATQSWCAALLAAGNPVGLADCSERFLRVDPEGESANFFGAITALQRGDDGVARARLEKAKPGLAPAAYDALRRAIDESEAHHNEPLFGAGSLRLAGILVAAWVVLMIVLFGAGTVLSRKVLRMTANIADADPFGTAGERTLRRVYKVVLVLSGLSLYVTMPVLVISVIAGAIAAFALFDAMGGIPMVALILIIIVVVGTIMAVLRSLFVKTAWTPSGKRLELERYPDLRALLADVAAAIGTSPPDSVYLVPGTEMCVLERASLWGALRGKRTERCLLMGVGLFDGMTQLQLRSILAHECGHFRNTDTAGGGFALSARRSLLQLVERFAASRINHVFNPAWWILKWFFRAYFTVSQGASRLQEILADRWSIRAYGSEAFATGYRHVIARSVEFGSDLDLIVKEAVFNKWALGNVYEIEPNGKLAEAELADAVEKTMSREATRYDSHPSNKQRIELAKRLDIRRDPQDNDDVSVWKLFPDAVGIELELTAIIRDRVRTTMGIVLPEHDADADAAS